MEYRWALLFSSLLLILCCFIAALWIKKRGPKIAVFLSLLLFAAVTNSAGGITHLYQFWLWSSALLAWAPTAQNETSRKTQMLYKLSWWGAQSIVLLMYGLSGMWKVIGLAAQFVKGEPHFLSPNGLSYHLASEVIRAGSDPLLGPWLLQHPDLQPYIAFIILTIQLSCFVGIFRLYWRPYIAIALLGFHLATFLFLSISYPTNFALIPILFLLSPRFRKKTRP